MSVGKGILGVIILALVAAALYVGGAWLRLYGEHEGAGEFTASPIPEAVLEEQGRAQKRAAAALNNLHAANILRSHAAFNLRRS